MINAMEEKVRKGSKIVKKDWITDNMIEKMEERRKYRNAGTIEGKRMYKKLNNEVRRD